MAPLPPGQSKLQSPTSKESKSKSLVTDEDEALEEV